jgi:hypothetical protein
MTDSLKQVAEYITKMLRVFGLFEDEESIGFPMASTANAADVEAQELALKLVGVVSAFCATMCLTSGKCRR